MRQVVSILVMNDIANRDVLDYINDIMWFSATDEMLAILTISVPEDCV